MSVKKNQFKFPSESVKSIYVYVQLAWIAVSFKQH